MQLHNTYNTHATIDAVLKAKTQQRILSITPQQTVYEALEKMAAYDVGALLVLEDGRLVGILSERDYARRGILHGLSSRETTVREIMTQQVVTVTPRQAVDECMTQMTTHHFRHLPVVEKEQVVGLISIGDLVKWVIRGQQQAIETLEGYIVGSYPA
ncbi:CBS domain-containing protein [Telmatobacter bradus]|uniref:CBS domain-containing protein n=1 Tax=Telmatobacter bradus TaxID=474953 RepID=UPI003B438A22